MPVGRVICPVSREYIVRAQTKQELEWGQQQLRPVWLCQLSCVKFFQLTMNFKGFSVYTKTTGSSPYMVSLAVNKWTYKIYTHPKES